MEAESRSSHQASDPPFPKLLLDKASLGVGQSSVVERGAPVEALSKSGRHGSGLILLMNHRSGDLLEMLEFVVWQFPPHIAGERTGQCFSRTTSVDEDQRLAAGGHDVCHEPRKVVLLGTDFLNRLVREVNESIVIDTLLQGHRPPLTPDVFRFEPPREFLG